MKLQDTQEPAILIVDDEPETVKELGVFLENQGFQILGAQSGKQALRLVEQAEPRPELILLDVRMPAGIGGYETCRRLKENETTKDIPVIFLTALKDTTDKVQGFDVGGVDYITKPFDHHEVLARVNAHLTLRKLQQELLEEKKRFQTLTEAAFEGIVICDDQGHILETNQQLAEMFGFQYYNEILDRNIQDCVKEFSEDERPYRTTGIKKDGSEKGSSFPIEIHKKETLYRGHRTKVVAIRDLSWQKQLQDELKETIKERYRFSKLVGKSLAMKQCYDLIISVKESDTNTLLVGESGTGKELIARTINEMSHRNSERFVPVNCAAIPETLFEREFFGHRKGAFTGADRDKPGLFERAHQGVLFLDEVTELTPGTQAKLLRLLQEGEYTPLGSNSPQNADALIIAATNKDPHDLLRQGLLRKDFFYRISVIEIRVPPLRERKEDLPLLIDHILEDYKNKQENLHGKIPDDLPTNSTMLPAELLQALYSYQWPGNVRELQNVVQKYLATGKLEDVLTQISSSNISLKEENSTKPLLDRLKEIEKQMIIEALDPNKTQQEIANELGITKRTLENRLHDYGLTKKKNKRKSV